jgi:recombination protein RecA
VAPPFKEVEFDILFGSGISREGDLLDLAVSHNIVEKSGSWYSYNSDRVGQGREQAKDYFRAHPETCAELERQLFEKLGIAPKATHGAAAAAAATAATEAPDEKKPRVKAVK